MDKPLQYTPIGKWYGIISLTFIAIFANPVSSILFITPSSFIVMFRGMGDRTLLGSLILYLLIAFGYFFIALGLFREQKWARWFALAAYGLNIATILTLLQTIISTMLRTSPGFILIPGVLLRLIVPILGIFLVLKRPKSTEQNLRS